MRLFSGPAGPSRVFLAAGLVAAVGYFWLPNQVLQNAASAALLAAGVAVGVVAIRRRRPHNRVAWRLIIGGWVGWVVAGLLWSGAEDAHIGGLRIPAGLAFATVAPLIIAGLAVMARRPGGGGDRELLLDAAIASAGVGLLLFEIVVEPAIFEPGARVGDQLFALQYAIVAFGVVVVTLRLALAATRVTPSLCLLIASTLSLAIGDLLLVSGIAHGWYQAGHPLDVTWLLFGAFGGAAVLHPSMSEPFARRSESPAGRWRWPLLVGAALIAPMVGLSEVLRDAPSVESFAVSAIVFGLILARVELLVRDRERTVSNLSAAQEELCGALTALERSDAERRRLLEESVRVADRERSAMAASLHDGPVQRLSAVKLSLNALELDAVESGDAAMAEELRRSRVALGEEVVGLRRIMSDLRPPVLDERGLHAALRDHLDAFARDTGIRCDVTIAAHERLRPEVETALFRVVQEALVNVRKHAAASSVAVDLGVCDRRVLLEVRDDGRGCDVSRVMRNGHVGLGLMRERAEMLGGTWDFSSVPGEGSSVVVALPSGRRT